MKSELVCNRFFCGVYNGFFNNIFRVKQNQNENDTSEECNPSKWEVSKRKHKTKENREKLTTKTQQFQEVK